MICALAAFGRAFLAPVCPRVRACADPPGYDGQVLNNPQGDEVVLMPVSGSDQCSHGSKRWKNVNPGTWWPFRGGEVPYIPQVPLRCAWRRLRP